MRVRRGLLAAVPAFFAFMAIAAITSAWNRFNEEPREASGAEEALARNAWMLSGDAGALPWADASDLRNVSVAGAPFDQPVNAASAILIDASTGAVLYEKNADVAIPPASMTKLVAMHVAFKAIEAGELSLNDAFEPPEPSWAENLPPRSSLMFLGRGQRLTLDELLRGMAVVSGNDAAIALAYRVSGGVEAFVDRMNDAARDMGLAQTRFAEPTGLSADNRTTAREFANFAMVYLKEHPEAAESYHSIPALTYPQAHNLSEPGMGSGNSNRVLGGLVPITQRATNPLLGALPGCDGLKTGYIDESGYNLALTAVRGGTRFISVTLGGPGNGAAEGNRYRSEDGTALMEWAFSAWKTVPQAGVPRIAVVVWGSAEGQAFAIPARTGALTVGKNAIEPLHARLRVPKTVKAPIQAGDRLGSVEWIDETGTVWEETPMIADRNAPEASPPVRFWDSIVRTAASVLALE